MFKHAPQSTELTRKFEAIAMLASTLATPDELLTDAKELVRLADKMGLRQPGTGISEILVALALSMVRECGSTTSEPAI